MAKWEIELADGSKHVAEGATEEEARQNFESGGKKDTDDIERTVNRLAGGKGGGKPKGPPMLSDAVAEAQGDIPRIMNQINEDSIAGALGFPVDAAAAALRFVGMPIPDDPVGGSESIRELMRATGASKGSGLSGQITGDDNRPKTVPGKMIAGGVGGAIESVLQGGVIGSTIKKAGENFAKPALEKTGEIIRNVRGNVAAGGGGGIGEEAGRGIGKGTPLEGPLDILGEAGGGFLGGMIEPAAALRPKAPRAPQNVIDAYERLNLAPSAAESGLGGQGVRWVQGNILPQTLGGSEAMEKFRSGRMEALNDVQQGIARSYGDIKPREAMGGDIKANVKETWENVKSADGKIIGGFNAKYGDNDVFSGALANAVDKPVGMAGVSADVMAKTVDPLVAEATELIRKRKGILKFADLAALKKKYGDALEPGLQKNVNDAQVQQLYSAVKSDMENYIRMTNPDDYRVLKESNARYADAQKQFRAHFKKLLGTGDVPVRAEAAYDIVKEAATEKGRANMELFRQVWDTLSPETRGNLTATILGRMGGVPPSEAGNWERWQMGRFLSEYRNLSDEAKDMLFANKKDVRQAWDDLQTVASHIQEKLAKLASSSRSGTGALVLGQFGLGGILNHLTGGGWGAVGAVLWGVGGPWAAAHALTDARLVRTITGAVNRIGNGLDGAGRAMIDLSSLPKGGGGRPAVIPQKVIDETPSTPTLQ